jgi:hypothetical protein
MTVARNKTILYALILAFTFISPFLFPDFGTQLATLWLMIIVALTWAGRWVTTRSEISFFTAPACMSRR